MAKSGRVQVKRHGYIIGFVLRYRFYEHIGKSEHGVYGFALAVVQRRYRIKGAIYKTVAVDQNEFFHTYPLLAVFQLLTDEFLLLLYNIFHNYSIICLQKITRCVIIMPLADVVELADAPDSKSGGSDTMWVQVPPSAPNKNNTNPRVNLKFVLFFTENYF